MSEKLISLSHDLKKLRDQGLELEIKHSYLIVHSVPYVNAGGDIAFGALVTDLNINNERTLKPKDHQVWFTGSFPHFKAGKPIEALRHTDQPQTLCDDVVSNHRFSCKPQDDYPDYYEKMTRHVEIIQNPARAIDPNVTAYTFKPVIGNEEESVFLYMDTASSRYGLTGLSQQCAMNKAAIVGLGGTGSYILDLIAKTHVKEIHLIDGDKFVQHNAFRAPGAASLKTLEKMPSKVDYYAGIYSNMRRGIIPHNTFLDSETIELLADCDFVFMCVDKPPVRKLAFEFLIDRKIPFIDVGMELEYIEEQQCLIGDCRTTLCTPSKTGHLPKRVSVRDTIADDIYDANIQVAEMNAMNAAFAVVKWKKFCGYYQDLAQEHHTVYSLNAHGLSRDEMSETEDA
ncbi:ThiF family adenylyltransferase [Haliea sp. E1-2-M8]|uniref:ThiF family adenylyltransferase n=1 Tax=Haliea sp. E1-2-M8 TaxID=3064706 RepID=UPI00271F3487|nr:ThiF family adenylyltransferase [Haliea sp. E1-2-M8]MDO8863244.1 ThiF family adenylyltransferase [Haliea sp. E1-2-M8]